MNWKPSDIAMIRAIIGLRGAGGGDPTGTTDHRRLTHRDAAGQHPIKAITGLEEALEEVPRPMTAAELQKILNGGTNNEQHT